MKNIIAFTFAALLVGAFLSSPAPAQSPGKYKNFRVAIYVTREARSLSGATCKGWPPTTRP